MVDFWTGCGSRMHRAIVAFRGEAFARLKVWDARRFSKGTRSLILASGLLAVAGSGTLVVAGASFSPVTGPAPSLPIVETGSIPEQPMRSVAEPTGEDTSIPGLHLGPRALVQGTDNAETPQLAAPITTNISYRIQAGDNLSTLAARYGLDVQHLASVNNLRPPYRIKAGERLSIPVMTPGPKPANDDSASKLARSEVAGSSRDGVEPRQGPPEFAEGVAKTEPVPALATAENAEHKSGRGAPIEGTDEPVKKAELSLAGPRHAAATGTDNAGNRQNVSPSSRGTRQTNVKQENFIAMAALAAKESQASTGVPASVTIAQAILESKWGQSTIGGNNYFGIKAHDKPGPAGIVWAKTKEFTGSKWITISAPFRAYESMGQSFTDHASFFVENPRYAEALRHAADPKKFAELIHKAGYATDPVYAKSLIRLMDQFDLYRFNTSRQGG